MMTLSIAELFENGTLSRPGLLPRAGDAPIKQEYLVPAPVRLHSHAVESRSRKEQDAVAAAVSTSTPTADDRAETLLNPSDPRPSTSLTIDSPTAATDPSPTPALEDQRDGGDGEPPAKKVKLSGAQRKKLAKAERAAREKERKAQGGGSQNKGRKFDKVRDEVRICGGLAQKGVCDFGEGCKYSHDLPAYLSTKPPSIHFPTKPASSSPPFFPSLTSTDPTTTSDSSAPSTDSTSSAPAYCPVFALRGFCPQGLKCRFLDAHVVRLASESGEGESGIGGSGLELVRDEGKAAAWVPERGGVGVEGGMKLLRTRKYRFPLSDAYLKELEEKEKAEQEAIKARKAAQAAAQAAALEAAAAPPADTSAPTHLQSTTEPTESAAPAPAEAVAEKTETDVSVEAEKDTPDVPLRAQEKRRLDWRGQVYLAPLTTVGNLPFRRLCVDLGADITCSEMGLAASFLQGSQEEWSRTKRASNEKTFGVQICGNKPVSLVPTAEALARASALSGNNIDFIDVNCGCPIDLVFQKGGGSALMDAPGKLMKILHGLNRVTGDIPITIKMRMGVKDNRFTAHNLLERLAREGVVGAATLHGRTRQQRYSKEANWDYIRQCVESTRATIADNDLPYVPIFGNGDVYSASAYYDNVERTGVDGIMLARGALVKPWLCTEIKERREIDISATERLEMLRRFAEYGMDHWGSDTLGVNTTRRFFCEALSFQHRYVPIGLLERMPGRLNDRPPYFRGRNELETLLASPNSEDWVKISEMFLGPAPESWKFTPKHKSNAYEGEGGGEDQG